MTCGRHLATGNGTITLDIASVGQTALRGGMEIAAGSCSCHLTTGDGKIAFIGSDATGPTLGHHLAAENSHVTALGGDAIVAARGLKPSAAGDREIAHGSDAVVEVAVGVRAGDSILPYNCNLKGTVAVNGRAVRITVNIDV